VKQDRALAARRLSAFAVDWLVVMLWAGTVFGVVMIATGGRPRPPGGAWSAQGLAFTTMTLPVLVYYALCESSVLRASLGKRALGLVVGGEQVERLSFASALLRSAVELAPWELGHTVAHQAAFSGEGGLPAWVWGPATIAAFVPMWWLASLIATGRTPYDRWTRTRVTRVAGA